MGKKKILIVLPDFPYPPRRNGISIRYYPIIEYLGARYDLHILAICKNFNNLNYKKDMEKYVSKVFVYNKKPITKPVLTRAYELVKSFIPFQKPYGLVNRDQKKIDEVFKENLSSYNYDIAVSVTVNYFHEIKKFVKAKKYIIDGIDSRYLHNKRRGSSILDQYKAFLEGEWEAKCARESDYISYVSPVDANIIKTKTNNKVEIGVIPNGLFLDDFTEIRSTTDVSTIGFLGNMQYDSNIEAAVQVFDIYRVLKGKGRDIRYKIIGRNPVKIIRDLEKTAGVEVTGSVDSIWHHINSVSVFVFPMMIGSGQQNKLLEAMYAGRPVVTTNLGNSGVQGIHGEHLIIANSQREMVKAIIRILDTPGLSSTLGNNGKEFVINKYKWSEIFKKIEKEWNLSN